MVLPKTHYIYEDNRPICKACNKHCETYEVDLEFDAWGPMGTTVTVTPDGHGDILSECHKAEVR